MRRGLAPSRGPQLMRKRVKPGSGGRPSSWRAGFCHDGAEPGWPRFSVGSLPNDLLLPKLAGLGLSLPDVGLLYVDVRGVKLRGALSRCADSGLGPIKSNGSRVVVIVLPSSRATTSTGSRSRSRLAAMARLLGVAAGAAVSIVRASPSARSSCFLLITSALGAQIQRASRRSVRNRRVVRPARDFGTSSTLWPFCPARPVRPLRCT